MRFGLVWFGLVHRNSGIHWPQAGCQVHSLINSINSHLRSKGSVDPTRGAYSPIALLLIASPAQADQSCQIAHFP